MKTIKRMAVSVMAFVMIVSMFSCVAFTAYFIYFACGIFKTLFQIGEYSAALVQADKQFDMHIYTNRNHGIRGGNTTKHLLTRVCNFFVEHLK